MSMRMMRRSNKFMLLAVLVVEQQNGAWSTFVDHTASVKTNTDNGMMMLMTEQQQRQEEDASSSSSCPLRCQNGGVCVPKRSKDDDSENASTTFRKMAEEQPEVANDIDNEWECECPPGHFGNFCELRPKRNLAEPTIQCPGNLKCYNGGECMEGPTAEDGVPVCDCTDAWDITGVAGDMIKRYVGKTCQTEVKKEDYCPGNKGINRELFCLNGGTCRTKADNYDEKPCKCPSGFKGRHCEYASSEVASSCTLDCGGFGTCEHGSNPFSDNGANGVLDLKHDGNKKYMYCHCDEEHAGTNCEYEYTKCDTKDSNGRRQFCFHGSTCLVIGKETMCQCADANGVQVAGDSCEFHATDNCVNPTAPVYTDTPARDQIIKQNELPFCVNNGKCRQDPDGPTDEFFCECQGTGWTGKRCETREIIPPSDGTPSASPTWIGTDTWPPTVAGSLTYWPSPNVDPDRTPTDAGGDAEKKNSVVASSNDNNNGKDGGGMSGFGKFAISFIVLAAVATIAVVAYRHYGRIRFGKETDAVGGKNLQLDMISEENDADGMTSVNLSDANTTTAGATNHHATATPAGDKTLV
ncbi:hypothetical protein ACA910_018492 [Epithemia clementina (nom. ined.)]